MEKYVGKLTISKEDQERFEKEEREAMEKGRVKAYRVLTSGNFDRYDVNFPIDSRVRRISERAYKGYGLEIDYETIYFVFGYLGGEATDGKVLEILDVLANYNVAVHCDGLHEDKE